MKPPKKGADASIEILEAIEGLFGGGRFGEANPMRLISVGGYKVPKKYQLRRKRKVK